MKRFLSLILLVLFFAVPFSCQNKEAKGPLKPIVILYENDVHCAVDGYAKLAGLRNTLQDSFYVAIVSAGDYLQGATVGALSLGSYIEEIQEAVGYDAMTLGNHEFDYFTSQLFELIREFQPPVVCANLYDAKTGERCLPAYIIKQYGPKKVAFVGVTTPETADDEYYALYDEDGNALYDLRPDDVYTLVQQSVDEARGKGADYVVVLSHLGESPTLQNVDSHGLIAATSGIDIVLDGHTHSTIPAEILNNKDGEPVLISQTGTAFQNIGKVVIEEDGQIRSELIPVSELTEEDPKVAEIIESVKGRIAETTMDVLGESEVDLLITGEDGKRLVRRGETNTGDLLCDAFCYVMDVPIAMSNGGGIRTNVPAGVITYGDITDIYPFVNFVYVVEMTGDDILQVIHHCTRKAPEEEDGDFPQLSGIQAVVNLPDHSLSNVRVRNAEGAWEAIDPEAVYSVATINYCVNGGGFAKLLQHNKILKATDIFYRDAVARYIVEKLGGHIGQEYAKPQGRLVLK